MDNIANKSKRGTQKHHNGIATLRNHCSQKIHIMTE